jgi:thiol-disulfide isomerase/thioredoxin
LTGAAQALRSLAAAFTTAFTAACLACLSTAALAAELRPWTGAAPTPFTLTDLDGKAHRLTDYKGKVLVINFWATWCKPCREEMPSMQRLQDKLAGRPFALVAVDFGESEPKIREFLQQVPVRFPILLDRDTSIARAWRVRVLPVTFVLDAEQKIRYSVVGDLDWSSPAVETTIVKLLPAGTNPMRAEASRASLAPRVPLVPIAPIAPIPRLAPPAAAGAS